MTKILIDVAAKHNVTYRTKKRILPAMRSHFKLLYNNGLPGPIHLRFLMKIVVTGATGFLGGRLLERLAQEASTDTEVVGIGRTLKPGNTVDHKSVRYELGNLEDTSFVQKAFHGADKVVHAAALSAQMGPPGAFERANVMATQHVVDACVAHGVQRLVLISSPSVYFQMKDQPNIQESDPLPAPINVYAKTKRAAERIVQNSGIPHVILRPRALIGRGDTVILPRVIRAHAEGRLRRMGSQKNKVDLTPVSNVVDAICLGLNARPEGLNQIYNISNGDPIALAAAGRRVRQARSRTRRQDVSLNVAKGIALARVARHMAQWPQRTCIDSVWGGNIDQHVRHGHFQARKLLDYKPRQSVEEAIQNSFNGTPSAAMTQVELHVRNSGLCWAQAHHTMKGAPRKDIQFYATWAELIHPQHGTVLFDTGYTSRFHDATARFPNSIYANLTAVEIEPSEAHAQVDPTESSMSSCLTFTPTTSGA